MRRMFRGGAGMAVSFILGLVLATAGTATAAKLITGKQIKDGTISSKDLTKAVQKQLKKAGLPGPPVATGGAGAKGDAGAPGATGTIGATGATGPAGSAVAYAHVASNATFTPGLSKNAGAVAFASAGQQSFYCVDFTGITAAQVDTVTATLSSDGSATPGEIDAGIGCSTGAVTAGDVFVRTYNSAGTNTVHNFDVIIH